MLTDLGVLRGIPGEPYSATQESFLCNLAKLLNESDSTNVNACIRWHPTISNALQVNWDMFDEYYDQLCPILVAYKIFRANNTRACARASWNRKLPITAGLPPRSMSRSSTCPCPGLARPGPIQTLLRSGKRFGTVKIPAKL